MEDVVEEIDDNDLELIDDQDVIDLEPYQVEEEPENGDEEGGEQMADEEEVVEVMEREDSVCIFEKHMASVFSGSISKDCKCAVTGGEDDKAYVWDIKTGQIVLDCLDHKDSVIYAEFSFDDQYLVTGDMSGFVQVRKMPHPKVVWDYNMGDATWFLWHHMAHVLLAGSVEGEIYMWKIPDGDCKIIQGFGKRAETGCLFPDGKRLVVGYEDGIIRVIDLKASAITATITSNTGHSLAITSLDCHLDNNLIISSAVDGRTIISSANTGKVINILQNLGSESMEDDEEEAACGNKNTQGNWVESVAFLKDAKQIIAATGTLNGEIFIWNVAKKTLRHKVDQGSGVAKLAWKENTSLLFSAGLDGIVRCYDGKSGNCVRTFLGHTEDILDLCISKDGKLILTTSDDTTARVFEIDGL
ncbi:angio-associated migratory cell protein isoform X2 [Copidosoma floridanum]|uniref:angio-associated migratory cell protein isoform X1 n=1 Tax=Copidosoma floridanum TaxID=29053 RepID=UPI0006C93EF8|nr:angio-associated migratory cell protein isoform X1 [Copidosoma floridanum]XP_023246348.1 angio-associated migratory cell protein isoform X2 [Copidosoma floridanum]